MLICKKIEVYIGNETLKLHFINMKGNEWHIMRYLNNYLS